MNPNGVRGNRPCLVAGGAYVATFFVERYAPLVRLRPRPLLTALCSSPAVKRPSGNKTFNSTTANRRARSPILASPDCYADSSVSLPASRPSRCSCRRTSGGWQGEGLRPVELGRVVGAVREPSLQRAGFSGEKRVHPFKALRAGG